MMSIDQKRKAVLQSMKDGNELAFKFVRLSAQRAGFNPSDMRTLEFLIAKKSATAGELAEFLGLTSGATTALIDRLEKMNLVVRKVNAVDKRIIEVSLNPKHNINSPPFLFKELLSKLQKKLVRYSEHDLEVIDQWNKDLNDTFEKSAKELEK